MAFIVIICSTFLTLLRPYITKMIIDVSLVNKDYQSLVQNVLLFIATFILIEGLSIIQSYILIYVNENILYDLRMKFYKSISEKNLLFFNQLHTGELMSRILNELQDVVNLFSSTLINILIQIATLIITLLIMLSINRNITLISIIIIPFVVLVLKYFNPKYKKVNQLLMVNYSEVHDVLQENLSNMKIVKYMNTHDYTAQKLSTVLRKYISGKYKALHLQNLSKFILATLYILPSIILLLYGGYLVIIGILSVGSIVALSNYISQLFIPVRSLSNINIDMQKSLTALERYYGLVMAKENSNDNVEYPKHLIDKIHHAIQISNLTFSYNKKHIIFEDFNLTLTPGQTIQIHGLNGSGKSTLIDLLCGLLPLQHGTITYDDIEIYNLDRTQISQFFGIVPQNIYLFNDTIRNNILMGREFSDQQIQDLSHNLDFIDITAGEKLNLDSPITADSLSGGQKQKIAILRALITNPQVIILDEPSSFLDEKSKKSLYQYIAQNKADKIILLITHESGSQLIPDNVVYLSPTSANGSAEIAVETNSL